MKISIVIPTLNEESNLPLLLASLSDMNSYDEVIVVDGGSYDGTVGIANQFGVKVIETASGRGHQLDVGSEASGGDVLLYIHADSRFDLIGIQKIKHVLQKDSELVGGNFQLLFDGTDDFSKFMNRFYAGIRKLGFYYGDSGIFVRRWVYEHVGGFHHIPIMEDYDFVRRMERFGKTCCIQAPPIITSTRRFKGKNPIQMFWLWGKMHALYNLGISPEVLAKIYMRTN